jgi:tRNA G18 (ribose-2'-O)-methylase SpoU
MLSIHNRKIRLILDGLRSAHNVGAILRTADACGVDLVYACGTTPYPVVPGDLRPPHVADSNTRQIAKSALGSQLSVPVLHYPVTTQAIAEARSSGFKIIVVEQAEKSLNLYHFEPEFPLALVLGREVGGVGPQLQSLADAVVELPMAGRKESLNVAVAAGVAMYHLRFGH